MPTPSSLVHSSSSIPEEMSAECDLCQSTQASVAWIHPEENSSILICEGCRLMRASPPLSSEALDSFYDDTFANDPGCQLRAGSNFPPDKDRKKEEVLAETWGIKIIKRFIDPRGKRILDLRCRTGALTSILKEEGAEVIGVEPFDGNANFARQARGLSNVIDLPFSRLHQFPLPSEEYYDVINILPHHVLAHVLSPRRLLEQVLKALKPGGYVFLDEKDVLHPARHKKQSALDSGPAHQFHLTLQTTAQYFRTLGFNLLEYEIDKNRSSDFRHIRIVAQKPHKRRSTTTAGSQIINPGPSADAIRRRLRWLERGWNVRLTKLAVKKKALRILKKVGL